MERMEPLGTDEIRRSFVNCSKSQVKAISFPKGYDALDWASLDYLGWRDPKAPNRGYLVVPRDGGIVGIAVSRGAHHDRPVRLRDLQQHVGPDTRRQRRRQQRRREPDPDVLAGADRVGRNTPQSS